MYLSVLNDNGKVEQYHIMKQNFIDDSLYKKVGYIANQSKMSNALQIITAYFSDAKAILLDDTNKAIVKQLEALSVPVLLEYKNVETIFDKKDFFLMYYTSGTTGIPVGALKSKENINAEIEILTEFLATYGIKKVVVTVPFIHLYGTLFGLLYPMINDIDIVIKEHFLPHDLLDLINPYTMVVTTPLYIKALNKLSEKKDLSKALFISSTAHLDEESIQSFNTRYHADIMQIFGSTETGGIAYKLNTSVLWKPFEKVAISTNKKEELVVSSPFVSNEIYTNKFVKTNQTIETFDYVQLKEEGFTLLGRSSKIFKLAGKRYSTVQIENILENIKEINKALVFVVLEKDALRGEFLDITIESNTQFSVKEIKSILKGHLSNLKFSIHLSIVDKIPINQVGKKLRIK